MKYPLVLDALNGLKVQNKITISNLKNPSVYGSYNIDAIVYNSLDPKPTTAKSKKRETLTITAPTFVATGTVVSAKTDQYTLFELKFDAPLDLKRANRDLTNYYDQFSHIYLKFP